MKTFKKLAGLTVKMMAFPTVFGLTVTGTLTVLPALLVAGVVLYVGASIAE